MWVCHSWGSWCSVCCRGRGAGELRSHPLHKNGNERIITRLLPHTVQLVLCRMKIHHDQMHFSILLEKQGNSLTCHRSQWDELYPYGLNLGATEDKVFHICSRWNLNVILSKDRKPKPKPKEPQNGYCFRNMNIVYILIFLVSSPKDAWGVPGSADLSKRAPSATPWPLVLYAHQIYTVQ